MTASLRHYPSTTLVASLVDAHTPHLPGQTAAQRATDLARCAARMSQEACATACQHALDARGHGTDWADLCGPLGLTGHARHADLSDAAAAFLWCATGHARPPDSDRELPRVEWVCAWCGHAVTDYGPHTAVPGPAEHGHHHSCQRHHTPHLPGQHEPAPATDDAPEPEHVPH